MPISVFTVGAMADIWGSVNYAEADPFSCSPPNIVIQSVPEEGEWILRKPIGMVTENGTVIPLP